MSEFKIADIGELSSGTMRSDDLAPVFIDALEELGNPDASKFRDAWSEIETGFVQAFEADENANTHELECEADELVNELVDVLQEHAPGYCTFGSHPGDGACFGFFPCEDWEQMMKDDGVEFVNDLADIETREICLVNDHGNVTFGYLDSDGFHETWSIV